VYEAERRSAQVSLPRTAKETAMPPEYLKLFLANPELVDAFLGEYEEEGVEEIDMDELLRQLSEDPDVIAVLEAAELSPA
jgi:hypothetical protein